IASDYFRRRSRWCCAENVRAALRDRPGAGRRRRAVGDARAARPPARSEAVHGPATRAAPPGDERPHAAAEAARARRRRPASAAAAARCLDRLRADGVWPRVRARPAGVRPLGAKSLGAPSPGAVTRPEWLCVALKAFFSADAARSVRATIDLGLGGERYALRIDRGTLEASVGAPAVADLGLTCDVPTLLGFLHGAPVPAHALGAEGDLGLLERLPAIFAFGSERPERAGAPAA